MIILYTRSELQRDEAIIKSIMKFWALGDLDRFKTRKDGSLTRQGYEELYIRIQKILVCCEDFIYYITTTTITLLILPLPLLYY